MDSEDAGVYGGSTRMREMWETGRVAALNKQWETSRRWKDFEFFLVLGRPGHGLGLNGLGRNGLGGGKTQSSNFSIFSARSAFMGPLHAQRFWEDMSVTAEDGKSVWTCKRLDASRSDAAELEREWGIQAQTI
jgi:hypothetical protein